MKKVLSPRAVFERSLRESDVVGAIINLLELNRARVFKIVERIPWGKTTSTPGLPDLMVIWPNTFGNAVVTFIEVKRKGGKLRPAQERWLTQAREDGVICFMADSVESMVHEYKKFGITVKGLQ